ncbi:MAG: phosphatase PAP2 family protein [Chitinophagaceae bacterium]
MKEIILSIAVSLYALNAMAQTNTANRQANYEAANWQPKLLDKPAQITIAAPPAAAQSKAELQSIKKGMTKLDKIKLAEIKYWDAGAPSYRWNQITTGVMNWNNPDLILRTPLAWVNIAIYDATILAWKEKIKYKRKRPHEIDPSIKMAVIAPRTYSYPCEHSVTAAAAATVLAYFLPDKADSILKLARAAAQSRVDAGVQFPSDVAAGWTLGEQVAKEIIEQAKKDGSDKVYQVQMNKDPKKWTGAYAMGIKLSIMTPLVLRSADQFRPTPPPDFETDMKAMKNFKQTFKSRSLAYYWANSGPELYNELASQKLFEYRMMDDAPAAARVYTILHTAFHDMTIAVFDAKYTYWGIRPAQYDSSFKPLIMTPPFPGYPSGHAAGAGTTSAVLEYFFPADAKQFQQMAQDCADSRFYAGIHFKTDNETALKMGKDLGKYIVETWMKK